MTEKEPPLHCRTQSSKTTSCKNKMWESAIPDRGAQPVHSPFQVRHEEASSLSEFLQNSFHRFQACHMGDLASRQATAMTHILLARPHIMLFCSKTTDNCTLALCSPHGFQDSKKGTAHETLQYKIKALWHSNRKAHCPEFMHVAPPLPCWEDIKPRDYAWPT